MDISTFTTPTVAEHIKLHCALTPLEQLAIIVNSRQPLTAKRAACEELLGECAGDEETENHLRRNIARLDESIAKPNPKRRLSVLAHYEVFSEPGLDSGAGRAINWWWVINERGEIGIAEDRAAQNLEMHPERRYVPLGDVFLPGDIVKYSGVAHPDVTNYGVIALYDLDLRASRERDGFPNAHFCFNSQLVLRFRADASERYLRSDYLSTFALERCGENDLPEDQQILARISKHLCGGKRIKRAELAELDKNKMWFWNEELVAKVRAERARREGVRLRAARLRALLSGNPRRDEIVREMMSENRYDDA